MSELLKPGRPLQGGAEPEYGGLPDRHGCHGCIDCCHLPEISVTDQEAERLKELSAALVKAPDALVIHDDPSHPGWSIMQGPCPFRRYDAPLGEGGCRIYHDRPAGCRIFTCSFRLALLRD